MTFSFAQPAFLKLRLRPDDPYSHPLFGERSSQQNGLLLRIARPKGQPDAAPAVRCIARVTASYAFNGLADYQVCGVWCAVECHGVLCCSCDLLSCGVVWYGVLGCAGLWWAGVPVAKEAAVTETNALSCSTTLRASVDQDNTLYPEACPSANILPNPHACHPVAAQDCTAHNWSVPLSSEGVHMRLPTSILCTPLPSVPCCCHSSWAMTRSSKPGTHPSSHSSRSTCQAPTSPSMQNP